MDFVATAVRCFSVSTLCLFKGSKRCTFYILLPQREKQRLLIKLLLIRSSTNKVDKGAMYILFPKFQPFSFSCGRTRIHFRDYVVKRLLLI
jgi:hypothetical protein